MNPEDMIRTAIQKLMERDGEGWQVQDFVVALGLQRLNADGHLESTPWVWAPTDQPEWHTDGLLRAAIDMRDSADTDDIDDDF
jgi:hypothetical protein